MSVEELKEEALRLDPEARAYLARELLASLDALSDAEIDELWLQEAIRRDEELDGDTGRVYPAEEVFDRTRARRK